MNKRKVCDRHVFKFPFVVANFVSSWLGYGAQVFVSISLDAVKVFTGEANTTSRCLAYTSVVCVGLVQSIEDL